MKYKYWNRYLLIENKKYLLEWCDGPPHIKNMETNRKIPIEMIDISNFTWCINKVKYVLNIDRSTRKVSTTKSYINGKYVEVEECECTIKTEKLA